MKSEECFKFAMLYDMTDVLVDVCHEVSINKNTYKQITLSEFFIFIFLY